MAARSDTHHEQTTGEDKPVRPRWRRWAWFAGLYLAGLAGIAAISYGLRLLIRLGM
jgi:hypothetical protein